MKKRLLSFVVICTAVSMNAQNPDIIGTYYFKEFPGDLGDPFPLMLGDAPQNPFIIINTDYTFEGLAACNTFSGKLNFNGAPFMAIVEDFTKTTINCSTTQYNQFEDGFFFHFDYFANNTFYIEGDSSFLYMESNPGFGLIFQDTPFLSTTDISKKGLSISPNPSKDRININSNGILITDIALFNAVGQRMYTKVNSRETIDVSSLESGIYFLQIISEAKMRVLKFIKE